MEHRRTLVSGDPVTDDHRTIDPTTGLQRDYVVLSDEERAKGFERPYRETYVHTVCGVETRMHQKIAETYARQHDFYSGTFCVACRAHFPLTEFVWKDGTQVGS
jgi:hypothetical protein